MTDFTTALNAGDPAFSCGFWIRIALARRLLEVLVQDGVRPSGFTWA